MAMAVFIFVFNHRISSFGNLLYQHCSVVTVWLFVVHHRKSWFLHFSSSLILKLLLFWKKSWILLNYLQTLWNYQSSLLKASWPGSMSNFKSKPTSIAMVYVWWCFDVPAIVQGGKNNKYARHPQPRPRLHRVWHII